MTMLPITVTEASGSTTPEASAINAFVTITNTAVVMLTQLAGEVRRSEPGTAEMIGAFAETVAGQAIDMIIGWPS